MIPDDAQIPFLCAGLPTSNPIVEPIIGNHPEGLICGPLKGYAQAGRQELGSFNGPLPIFLSSPKRFFLPIRSTF
jgi:hypothetical protein